MKKPLFSHILTAILILTIVGMGLFGVGYFQGWFEKADGTKATVADCQGTVLLYRSGVAFPVRRETVLRAGDRLVAEIGATGKITVADTTLTIGQQAQLTVLSAKQTDFSAELTAGELIADCQSPVRLQIGEKDLLLQNTVAIADINGNAVSVFSGDVDGICAGQTALCTVDGKTRPIELSTLSSFALSWLSANRERQELSLSQEQLAEAMQKADSENAQGEHFCTLTIRCDTVLDDLSALVPSKAEFIPADGILFPTTWVAFTQGETVFDLLKRVCTEQSIQLEYSWTPLHDSYYIESIAHLYEFDCGSESGWMYQVNGEFPNYGCSSYPLKDDDVIVWAYSCRGYGADLGATEWGDPNG